MKPNLLTAGRKALLARLATITPGNGYRTDVGTRVRSGWFNELIKDKALGFPLIVVQKWRGLEPVGKPGALLAPHGFHIIGAVDAGFDTYEDAIEDLQHDILCCLSPDLQQLPTWAPRGITGVTFGAPQEFPPGDGTTCATVIIPVHLKTIIEKG